MDDKYLELTKEIVLKNIRNEEISVFLFGSRVNNNYRDNSDIDVGFISNKKIKRSYFRNIINELEESRVPYHVDLIDFNNIDPVFKKNAMRKIIIWNKGKFLN